jgi:hypothetical protein
VGREISAFEGLEPYDGKLSRTVLRGRRAARPLATRCLNQITMKYENIDYKEKCYKWAAVRDSEHPDFVLICDDGEIWVQVERTPEIDKQDDLFREGKAKYPISLGTVQSIISEIVIRGYIESYFKTDVGLIYSEKGQLVEN